MITDFAQRLADCHDITTEQLEAVFLTSSYNSRPVCVGKRF
ncbi:hypothetical protein HNQ72_004636 [Rhizobium wenxiniae]|uniref:Uncharacterized protein n=1 Tax=Rhizobium wenxiniae TaxID=1737357 RepID=A0A7W9YA32_9HYPH|nr:hypothetical protein [Rhizobium wenxiniae]